MATLSFFGCLIDIYIYSKSANVGGSSFQLLLHLDALREKRKKELGTRCDMICICNNNIYIYTVYVYFFIYSISLSLSIWPNQSRANYQSLSKSPRHNFCAPWNRARSSFSVWSTSMILSKKRYSVAGNALECLKIGWRFLGIQKKYAFHHLFIAFWLKGTFTRLSSSIWWWTWWFSVKSPINPLISKTSAAENDVLHQYLPCK